jgi:L-fucose isomerase-like protein
MTALEAAEQNVRRAVQGGSFGEVQNHLAAYAHAVDALLAETGTHDQHAAATVRRALDFLRWAGRVARAGRAHAAMELARVSARRPYLAPARGQSATIQLTG